MEWVLIPYKGILLQIGLILLLYLLRRSKIKGIYNITRL
jgi:hypothetical protein